MSINLQKGPAHGRLLKVSNVPKKQLYQKDALSYNFFCFVVFILIVIFVVVFELPTNGHKQPPT